MREITYAEALREAIADEMRSDPDVFMMGEDIGVWGGVFRVSAGLLEEFGPDRIRDTPLSEAAFVGAAAGAAVTGMRPIVEIMFSDFLMITMDQLVNQAAKMRYMFGGKARVPMVIRTPFGSGMGAAAQHSQSLEAWYAHVPGLKTVAPSTPHDAKGLLVSAIRDDNPVVFFEHKLLYQVKGDVPEEQYSVPLGKADVKREGTDLSVFSWGSMVRLCCTVADELAASSGVQIEVVDLRSLRPLDTEAVVSSVQKTGRALVVHEATKFAGFGAEISALIAESAAFDYLDAPIGRLGAAETPVPYSPTLEASVIPTAETIRAKIEELLR